MAGKIARFLVVKCAHVHLPWLAAISFSSWLLCACFTAPTPAPVTPDLSIPFTMAAQTAEARATLSAGETAVAQLTQLASISNSPATPPMAPPASLPTSIFILPSPIPPAGPCYQAELVLDRSAPLNSVLLVGASFVKTWQIRNSGTCPWTRQFSLILAGGDPMGSASMYPISAAVPPGDILELSIGMVAPGFVGTHQSNWLLRSPDNVTFGVGVNAASPLQVIIRTVQPISWGSAAYDITLNFCQANWESGGGILGCPGLANTPPGSVTLLDQPALESGLSGGLALLTQPNQDLNGWIRGRFPSVLIRDFDHFMTEIGCLNGSPGCSLVYQLDYRESNGTTGRLGNWREVYDGHTTQIDIDLSNLAGKSVQLSFYVQNTGRSISANAFWLQPRIQNQTPSSTRILTWTRAGYPTYPCSELQIFLSNSGLAQAQAFSCSTNRYEIGRAGLSAQDVQTLVYWVQNLKSFDAEINRAAQGLPIITWIGFLGNGTNDARDVDLQAINNFATNIFEAIAP